MSSDPNGSGVKGLSHADYGKIINSETVEETPVERIRVTELYVPTGRIVATDPLVGPERSPFTRTVQPGSYPVDVYLASTQQSGKRIAIAVLTFQHGEPDRYELALTEGQSLDALESPDEYFGFFVDAGLGAFFDAETGALYNQFIEEFYRQNLGSNLYDDFLAKRFKANARECDLPRSDGDWLDLPLPNSPQHNVAIFASGYGDGVYPTYWGIDGSGAAVNLVIDFHVLLLPERG